MGCLHAELHHAIPELAGKRPELAREICKRARGAGPLGVAAEWLCTLMVVLFMWLVLPLGLGCWLMLAIAAIRPEMDGLGFVILLMGLGLGTMACLVTGAHVGLSARDDALRAKVRSVLLRTTCGRCNYPLADIPPVGGIVRCPECAWEAELSVFTRLAEIDQERCRCDPSSNPPAGSM